MMRLVTRMERLPRNRGKVPKLEQQLKSVAQALYRNVFNRPNGRDQQNYPLIAEIVEAVLPITWRNNPNSATIELFRRAVERLPKDERPRYMNVSWRYVGEVVYGFRDDLDGREEGGEHNYNTRLAFIRSLYDEATRERKSTSTFDRDVSDVLGATMAAIFEELWQAGSKESAGENGAHRTAIELRRVNVLQPTSAPDDFHSYYVPRQAEQHFAKLVADGHKIIALVGLPGMGKTWLARQLTNDAPPVRVEGGRLAAHDIRALITVLQIDLQLITDDPREILACLACGEQAPAFILLDGLASTAELHKLLPTVPTHSVIVATCRTRHSMPERCHVVDVAELSLAGAQAMTDKRLPGITNEDSHLLASSLHCYPLAISCACTLIAQSHIPVAQFCRDLFVDPATRLAVGAYLPTDYGATLIGVLQGIIDHLWQRDVVAFEMLIYLSALKFPAVTLGNLSTFLIEAEPGLTRTRCAVAMDELCRLSPTELNKWGMIRMPALLRDLFYLIFWAGAKDPEKFPNSLWDALTRTRQLIESVEKGEQNMMRKLILVGARDVTEWNFPIQLRRRPNNECALICQAQSSGVEGQSSQCIEVDPKGYIGVCRKVREKYDVQAARAMVPADPNYMVFLPRDDSELFWLSNGDVEQFENGAYLNDFESVQQYFDRNQTSPGLARVYRDLGWLT